MASTEESFDSIFGAEAAEEDTETTAPEEEDDDSNGSEADQPTEDEESDEEEESSRALAGLKKEASTQRKRAQEAEEKAKAFERLAADPRFITEQARRLGLQVSKADGTPQPDQQGGIDAEAPFYTRDPEGRADKRLDMREAVTILPDLPTDNDLSDEVMFLASKGRSIVEAAEIVRARYEKAGKATDAKENAKLSDSDRRKQRLSTSFAPGKGAPSKQAQLLKAVKSGSESERLMAGAELLGF